MPNVVVYVHAEHADKFLDENGERDQAALGQFVRAAAAKALSERGASSEGSGVAPRSDGTFRPDPKPGSRK